MLDISFRARHEKQFWRRWLIMLISSAPWQVANASLRQIECTGLADLGPPTVSRMSQGPTSKSRIEVSATLITHQSLKTNPNNMSPRIAIIGAGPAGLILALLLHNHKPSIPFTVFELRQRPTDIELAKPSGMLDLHDESGQAAIKDCGLWDEFLKLTGECAEAQRVADKDDGAWSKVRRLLTDVKPSYSGRHNITLTIRNIGSKYPDMAELVGKGSFSALGDNHGVMSQRGPQDSARIYVFLSTQDPDFAASSGIGGKPATAVKEILFNDDKLLGKWGLRMKELVAVACDEEAADNPGDSGGH
ncbi:hypothetical protein MRB53_039665 [Persea americana]|nr:hypothetical protein MRB53_039665 [Persea americana]